MKTIFTYFILLLFIHKISAQAPNIQWQKSLGGSLYDKAQSVIELSDGGYLIAGNSQSSNYDLTFNHGMFDWWIVRINKAGNIVWKKTLGGTLEDYVRNVIATPDGNFLCVGETQSNNGDITGYIDSIDFWVVKIDGSGNVIWKKCYGGTSIDRGYSACVASDGNLMIAGLTESGTPYVENNHGVSDYLVIKIDLNGGVIWQKTYGGSDVDDCKSIRKTSDNGYLLCGNSRSSNGDLSNNKGELDVWVVKINANGDIQWQNSFGGSKSDYANAIMEDKNGNFLIAGETYSFDFDATENHSNSISRDYFIIKVNSQGQKIWARCYGGSDNEYARGIIETNSDEYVIIGESYSNDGQAPNNKGSADFWLIKINPMNGDLIWEKKYGSDGHDEPNDLILSHDNDFVTVGNTFPVENLIDVSTKYGDDDLWIVKLFNNDCVKKLTLTTDLLEENREYLTSETIIGSAKIQNSTIIYSAGRSILLEKGFSTQNGAVFQAKIEGCN